MHDRLTVRIEVGADADYAVHKKDRTLEKESTVTEAVLDEIRLGPGSSRTLLPDTNTTGDGHEYLFISPVTTAVSSIRVEWADNSGNARELNIAGGKCALIPRLRTGAQSVFLVNNDMTDACEVVAYYVKAGQFWG